MFQHARHRLVLSAVLFTLSIGVAFAQTEKVYVTRTGSKYHRDQLPKERTGFGLNDCRLWSSATKMGCYRGGKR